MQCLYPVYLPDQQIHVPCGKCPPCKIRYTTEWAMRIQHEMTVFKGGVFATLTYSPEHVPKNYSIEKPALQKFFKRLRKLLGKRKIKYYACGEYGETHGRPHYHAIILGLDSLEARELIETAWKFGQIHIDAVNPKTVQYVTGYVQKKLVGNKAKETYEATGRQAPFRLSSLGMGLSFAKTEKVNIDTNKFITYNGRPTPIPRYYRKKLGLDDTYFQEKAKESEKELLKHFEENYGKPYTDSEILKAWLNSREKMIEIRKMHWSKMIEENRDYANEVYKARLQNRSQRKNSPF